MTDEESPLNTILWVERYRPRSLDDVALPEGDRNLFNKFLTQKEIPHLLFTGPAGTGKTTIAKILVRGIGADLLMLNASKDRGIDIIRDKVGTFAKVRSMFSEQWKVVFLDEADGVTGDAQHSLRNMMEDYHSQTRFILTANNEYKIIEPIKSRCVQVRFGEADVKSRLLILKKILEAEKTNFDLGVALEFANKYKDLRSMIMAAETSVHSSGTRTLGHADAVGVMGGEVLLHACATNKWDRLTDAISQPGADPVGFLRAMFWSVGDVKEIKKPNTWKFTIARAIHESQWTPDPVVHFLGTCANLISEQQ